MNSPMEFRHLLRQTNLDLTPSGILHARVEPINVLEGRLADHYARTFPNAVIVLGSRRGTEIRAQNLHISLDVADQPEMVVRHLSSRIPTDVGVERAQELRTRLVEYLRFRFVPTAGWRAPAESTLQDLRQRAARPGPIAAPVSAPLADYRP